MSIVVSDTSPIFYLDRVGQLDLLPSLYGTVIIPRAVHEELRKQPQFHLDLQSVPWIEIRAARDRARVQELLTDLDPGEAEAVALSIEIHADLLLVDEKPARRIATKFGLERTGLLGVLLEAKARGLITKVEPMMHDLRTAGFWIGEDVFQDVLLKAQEP
jgi:predicted nucleic acid-binding protein